MKRALTMRDKESADPNGSSPRERFRKALEAPTVLAAAKSIHASGREPTLTQMLELGLALSEACGADHSASILRAELRGYGEREPEVPAERKAIGFATPFPVRALDLGLLEAEEIFLANREKFAQVTLTIAQPIEELVAALSQIRQGGVLALKVPAREVTGDSANTEEDTEVFIYVLPREIQRIIDAARARALDAVITRIVDAAVGNHAGADLSPPFLLALLRVALRQRGASPASSPSSRDRRDLFRRVALVPTRRPRHARELLAFT